MENRSTVFSLLCDAFYFLSLGFAYKSRMCVVTVFSINNVPCVWSSDRGSHINVNITFIYSNNQYTREDQPRISIAALFIVNYTTLNEIVLYYILMQMIYQSYGQYYLLMVIIIMSIIITVYYICLICCFNERVCLL